MKKIRKLIALVVFGTIATVFVTPADAALRGSYVPPAGPVVIKPVVSPL